MRIWTLHPRYLDARGLVALWREALLAQRVLQGKTVGYRHHPQLLRFRAQADPPAAIASYLRSVADEAQGRGYRFDITKIAPGTVDRPMAEHRGQLLCEWHHLLGKLQQRQPSLFQRWQGVVEPEPHPLFTIVEGEVQPWERG